MITDYSRYVITILAIHPVRESTALFTGKPAFYQGNEQKIGLFLPNVEDQKQIFEIEKKGGKKCASLHYERYENKQIRILKNQKKPNPKKTKKTKSLKKPKETKS